jgi:[acyl-carrier-protein] S-malonyltransferase
MDRLLKEKSAFLFQGVGSKYRELLSQFDESQLKQLEKYSEIIKTELDIDLWLYVKDRTSIEDSNSFLGWILIFTCDYIVYKTYIEKGIKPEIMIGYSMGLISAMVCAEALSFEGGLRLLDSIYRYPAEGKRGAEAMATIIGLDYDSVFQIIEDVNLEEYVEIASENSEYCIVISGIKNAVYKVMELAEEGGAIKVILLNTPYAYHSNVALNGIEILETFVKDLEINAAKVPIMSVFTQSIMTDEAELRNELVINMHTSMKWKSTILKLGNVGLNRFIEVTLNDSLTKMSKVIDLNYEFLTYEKIILEKN